MYPYCKIIKFQLNWSDGNRTRLEPENTSRNPQVEVKSGFRRVAPKNSHEMQIYYSTYTVRVPQN